MWTTSAYKYTKLFLYYFHLQLKQTAVQIRTLQWTHRTHINARYPQKCWVSFPPVTPASQGRQDPCSKLAS